MNRRLQRVNIASLRVALLVTAIVAAVYAIVAVTVVVVVTSTLTSRVDSRLGTALSTVNQAVQNNLPPDLSTLDQQTSGGSFDDPIMLWLIAGDRQQSNIHAPLPTADTSITSPTTAAIFGHDLRLMGSNMSGVRVIVGQVFDSVTQTRSSIVTTELIVGPVLLVVAFFGSLFGGRRIGVPIELARQRQLEFTADASHELRTPLSVIEAQTSLALSQDRDPGWYRAAFERVGSESGRIRRLVEDLLWLARVDITSGQPDPEPVELGVLAQQAADRFAAVAESRDIRLTVSVGTGAQAVMGSPEWLDRLLGVLLDNACKYAPRQGRVAVGVSGDAGRVRLTVEDSGPGIPTEERPKIFDRFHRATERGSGAGLGLAIADAVVGRTHGRWEISTSGLGGASMAVSWPRALAGASDHAGAPAEPLPQPFRARVEAPQAE